MTPRAEIRILNVILIRRSRGPGWTVGEPYDLGRGEEVIRPGYYAVLRDAIESGLLRAAKIIRRGRKRTPGAEELLEAIQAPLRSNPRPPKDAGLALWSTRTGAGLSQRELSRRTGIARSTIQDIEHGQRVPRYDTWYRLMEESHRGLLDS